MKDNLFQFKRQTRADAIKANSNLKLTMNDPTLKKYLEMTVSRFTTKCSLLVNQIDDMKREFIAQIEGLYEFFPIPTSKTPLPFVSPVIKNKEKRKDHNHQVHLNEVNNSHSMFTDPNTNNNLFKANNNPNQIDMRKSDNYVNASYTKALKSNPEIFLGRKLSITMKDSNEEDIKLKINLSQDKKTSFGMRKIPAKTKALVCVSNSDLLCFEDKIKLKSLNKFLNKEMKTKEIITSSRKFLEEKMKGLQTKKNHNLPSQTSQSSLNFIKKENENELKDMSIKFNRAFYELVYILSGEIIPNAISYEHLYESVLRKNQAQSIKHLFLSVYLKKLVESPLEYSNEIINRFNSVINKNPELISQNELLSENKSLSLFAFCLKEFYQFFQYEMERRKEIQQLKQLLDQIDDWAKNHNVA